MLSAFFSTNPGPEEIFPMYGGVHLVTIAGMFIPVAILLRKYKWIKFVSLWSIGAGFISIVNPTIMNYPVASYIFIHYLWMHYFLILAPVFFIAIGEFRYTYAEFWRSTLALLAYSAGMFFVNWLFDTNYMYTGPHNDADIPFLPASMRAWPVSYLSYALVGIALFHLIFVILVASKRADFARA